MRTGLRVIIAEDEGLVAIALRCTVESWGHTVVGTARTGLEAVALCLREHPDLVLMDVQMPEMDGLTATRAVMEELPTTVVIVTGRARMEESAEAAGAMHCVVKPLLAPQIPEVIATPWARFARFMVVRQEHQEAREALRAWVLTQQAVRGLARTAHSEEEAFLDLSEMARTRGVALHQVAEALLAVPSP